MSESDELREGIKRISAHYKDQAQRLKHAESRDALKRMTKDFDELAKKPRRRAYQNQKLESRLCLNCGKGRGDHLVPDLKGKKVPVLLCPQLVVVRGFLSVFTVEES